MFRKMLSALILVSALIPAATLGSDGAPQVVYLWPQGASTLKGQGEREISEPPSPKAGERINSIKNVHNPSIEVHLAPADKANGSAIVVAPGGGHRQLVWGSEGTDIAEWLNG